MSYDIKYRSNFYNIFGKKVEVKIYKKDYGVHDAILLRSCEVSLEVNYQDENTPVVGTGLRVVIINQGEFNSLDDLLKTQEKQFECEVVYDNTIVFDGFSICDLNEQQFAPFAKITLQFTDYLRRLDSDMAPCLASVGDTFDLLTLIQDAITTIGLPRNLLVNSTLFETRMSKTDNDTFLEQTFLENVMFFSDANTHDNTYDALNKALKSFNAHFYSLGDAWALERIDDITRPPETETWVTFPNMLGSGEPIGEASANLRQWDNKQSGDFKYTDLSQVIEYDSGLQKLVLQLKDKQLDTLVFNNYKVGDILFIAELFPNHLQLLLKKWYLYSTNTVVRTGLIFRTITNYIEWRCNTGSDFEYHGLYYHFKLTFNQVENYVFDPESNPEIPTELSINFKQYGGKLDLTPVETVIVRFCLMINGWFLNKITDPGGTMIWALSLGPQAIRNDFDVSTTGNKDAVISVNETIDLSGPIASTPIPGGDVIYIDSIWAQLGRPATVDMVIMFFPIVIIAKGSGDPDLRRLEWADNYIGDIQVGIASQKVPNKLTYYIDADFIKTETLDMDFFDLINDNFGNGPLMFEDSANAVGVKTEKWLTRQHPIALPLMDQFARVKIGNYCHTLHKLKGTIIHDGYLKPFAVLTDDNLKDDNGNNIELILHGYTWNLNEGTYEIQEAVEFTEEVLEDSSGGAIVLTLTLSAYWLNWDWNSVVMQSCIVTTNFLTWMINPNSVYDGFTVEVYDPTDTFIMTDNFVSGCVIHVMPNSTNAGTSVLTGTINIANPSNETYQVLALQQYYQGRDNPPVVTDSVGDGSFTLSYFSALLNTNNRYIIVSWTPTSSGKTDYDIYIAVRRASDGVLIALAISPHNTDDMMNMLSMPFNVAPENSTGAVAGATYDVTFTTTAP